MGILADRMDALRVRVSSPDGKMTAELSGRSRIDLTLSRDAYLRYSEATLETQLIAMARLLWAGRTREYFAALSEALGQTVTREERPIGRQDIAFHEGRDALTAQGRSTDGRVRVQVRGMRDWDVRILPGTVRSLREPEFADRVREAAHDLIQDQFRQVGRLRQEVYGSSFRR